MIYLESVAVIESLYDDKKKLLRNFRFDCSEINILVGDQGTGKSTVLRLLHENSPKLKIGLSGSVREKGISSYYFDTEKNNPRTKDPQLFTTSSGDDIGMGYMGACLSRFRAHGEVMRDMVVETLSGAKDCVVILDEPESGLSVKSQFRLVESVASAVRNNCQLFIATHCVPLIEAYDVISLDHRYKKMAGEQYLNDIRRRR